jgi:hypothetical protein
MGSTSPLDPSNDTVTMVMQGDEVHAFLLFADTFLEDVEVRSTGGGYIWEKMHVSLLVVSPA